MEWGPNNQNYTLNKVPKKGVENSGTFVGNSTAIQESSRPMASRYEAMFKEKAFLHWYLAEGMDEMEFIEAERSLNDLISEYQMY
jgi:tubulin beta